MGLHGLIFAQIGYFNSVELLATLPETKLADQNLRNLQDSLGRVFEIETKELEAEYRKHEADYNNGLLSAKQIQQISQELDAKKEELSQRQSQLQFTLIQRREKLYKPTFNKVDLAVQEVGQQGGYKVIFDTSKDGGFLYLDDAMDITNEIKKLLGVQ